MALIYLLILLLQEDRKAKILERAYALRDARESERLKIVREKYDEQWRDACDDARNLDSKAMTRYMNEQRLQQIQDVNIFHILFHIPM